MTESSGDRNPVEQLAEEFVERFRRGERPSLHDYTAKYPQWADEIRELVRARRVGQAERLWRWRRRNPDVASLTAAEGKKGQGGKKGHSSFSNDECPFFPPFFPPPIFPRAALSGWGIGSGNLGSHPLGVALSHRRGSRLLGSGEVLAGDDFLEYLEDRLPRGAAVHDPDAILTRG